jgi:hypothetical protein
MRRHATRTRRVTATISTAARLRRLALSELWRKSPPSDLAACGHERAGHDRHASHSVELFRDTPSSCVRPTSRRPPFARATGGSRQIAVARGLRFAGHRCAARRCRAIQELLFSRLCLHCSLSRRRSARTNARCTGRSRPSSKPLIVRSRTMLHLLQCAKNPHAMAAIADTRWFAVPDCRHRQPSNGLPILFHWPRFLRQRRAS